MILKNNLADTSKPRPDPTSLVLIFAGLVLIFQILSAILSCQPHADAAIGAVGGFLRSLFLARLLRASAAALIGCRTQIAGPDYRRRLEATVKSDG